MSRPILGGSTDIPTVIRIIDSTDGTPETGVTSATSGLALWYRREGGTVVAITPITDLATADAAHSDGGIIHLSDGYYRVDPPDAAGAAGAADVLVGGSATGMVVIPSCHPIDPPTDVRKWLGTACSTPTTAGVPEVDVTYVAGTEASVGDDPPTAVEIRTEMDDNSTQLAAIVEDTGTTLSASIAAVKSDTAATLTDTGTDGVVVAAASKTGYKLASDGLDSVSTTGPDGNATNFREMIVALWRRFFGKATMTSSALTTYRDDNTTAATSQTLSDDGTTQSQGEASDA